MPQIASRPRATLTATAIVVMMASSVAAVPDEADPSQGERVRFDADGWMWSADSGARWADASDRLEGSVRAESGDWTLTAHSARRVEDAVALEGRVRVVGPDSLYVTGPRARLRPTAGRLVFDSGARLVGSRYGLEASVVDVDIETKTVRLEHVQRR